MLIAQLLIEDSLDIDALLLDALNTYETARNRNRSTRAVQRAPPISPASHQRRPRLVLLDTRPFAQSLLMFIITSRSSHAHLHSNMYILNMKTQSITCKHYVYQLCIYITSHDNIMSYKKTCLKGRNYWFT